MKKLSLLVLSILLSLHLSAQINTPVESPSASFSQKFGLTEIKMEYSVQVLRGVKSLGML
jgi:hypothetical protein